MNINQAIQARLREMADSRVTKAAAIGAIQEEFEIAHLAAWKAVCDAIRSGEIGYISRGRGASKQILVLPEYI